MPAWLIILLTVTSTFLITFPLTVLYCKHCIYLPHLEHRLKKASLIAQRRAMDAYARGARDGWNLRQSEVDTVSAQNTKLISIVNLQSLLDPRVSGVITYRKEAL